MNIIALIPPGWLTNIGAIIKILSAIIAILTAIQGGDLQTILQHISAAFGTFGAGSAVTALGLRRAIANSVPETAAMVSEEAAAVRSGARS